MARSTADGIPPLPKDRDAVVVSVAAFCACAALAAQAIQPRWGDGPATRLPVVATVTRASAELKCRPARTLLWTSLGPGGEVHEQDALYVPPGTEAQLVFQDGSVLELDERSLVVVEAPKTGRRQVALRQGSVATAAGSQGLAVDTPFGTTQVSPRTEARFAIEGESVALAVTKGEAKVGDGQTLGAGQRGELSRSGVAQLPAWPVTLESPLAGERRFFRTSAPPVDLSWKGASPGARVQVASDRGFSFVLQDFDASRSQVSFQRGEAGVFWWRVVDETGEPLSESRRFSLLEDVPPTPLTPSAAEVVLSQPDKPASFTWTQVRGVSRYRVELSATPEFSVVAWSQAADGERLRADIPLDEGTWFWRVRSVDAERGESSPSVPRRLRLVHKPLLEAPELLNSEIEVVPE